MTPRTSGDLVYWNAHTGFGEIDLDDGNGRIAIYRADLLKAGVKTPQVGDHFYFNTGVAAHGVTAAIDLCLDVGDPTHSVETTRARDKITS
jgi:cold shock CspA family protein